MDFRETAARVQGQTESYEPQRPPSAHSDVLVPILQAAVPGALVGLLALLTAFYLQAELTDRQWLSLFGFPFLFVTGWKWFERLGWISENTMNKVETLTRLDLNHDGTVGKPPTHWAEKHTWTDDERKEAVVGAEHRLAQFVRACYEHGTTFRELRAAGFDDRDIVKYRRICLGNRDIAYYENGKGGKWILTQTDPGEAIKRLAMRGMFLPEP
jgi:hypothetical protein